MTVIAHDLTPSATAADAKAVTYYPDDFIVETYGPFTSTNTTGVLHLCDREYFVDHVTLRAGVASAANVNFSVSYVPEGSAVSAANAVAVTDVFNPNTSSMANNSAYTIKGLTGGANRIPAGSLMVFEWSGTPTNLAAFYITVRFRSRLS